MVTERKDREQLTGLKRVYAQGLFDETIQEWKIINLHGVDIAHILKFAAERHDVLWMKEEILYCERRSLSPFLSRK